MDLNTIWFILVGVLLIGYTILDGFDLGVGTLHLFARNDEERRINMNAIGPVWDGNEVWLITGGGALFAAFPFVYATVFSGFYLALMLLLTALILRAVSMEFRSKVESGSWRKFWDYCFAIGSFLSALLFGVAFGNVLKGLKIAANFEYQGTFLGLLNPYAILVGLAAVAVIVMHGTTYMTMKTRGDLQERFVSFAGKGWIGFVVLYVVATIATFFAAPELMRGTISSPIFWILFIVFLASLVYHPVALKAKRNFTAFLSSSLVILTLMGICAVGLFPTIVPSSIDPSYSLTIYNASSTDKTLTVMLIIALVGMPLVIGYTYYIYRVFKGEVVITGDSY